VQKDYPTHQINHCPADTVHLLKTSRRPGGCSKFLAKYETEDYKPGWFSKYSVVSLGSGPLFKIDNRQLKQQ